MEVDLLPPRDDEIEQTSSDVFCNYNHTLVHIQIISLKLTHISNMSTDRICDGHGRRLSDLHPRRLSTILIDRHAPTARRLEPGIPDHATSGTSIYDRSGGDYARGLATRLGAGAYEGRSNALMSGALRSPSTSSLGIGVRQRTPRPAESLDRGIRLGGRSPRPYTRPGETLGQGAAGYIGRTPMGNAQGFTRASDRQRRRSPSVASTVELSAGWYSDGGRRSLGSERGFGCYDEGGMGWDHQYDPYGW
ncbi:uncharacterized protein LY89DRAFT_782859 [Mollisia scopiformis]|uniref:Uncharacterized protein n=1 Tax=Mollisia scopiformis TaxID=149040 RepID=A0A194XA40_MOLSC|nr:uncharacterized protein LY89DRAFT_782859 [Mollisia scopiformis]KUJ16632.1 hypothetical protein LY89DRAFT_782859 [Mollisia scopiformis]